MDSDPQPRVDHPLGQHRITVPVKRRKVRIMPDHIILEHKAVDRLGMDSDPLLSFSLPQTVALVIAAFALVASGFGEQTAHTGISLRAVLIVIVIQLLRSKGKVRNLASFGEIIPKLYAQTRPLSWAHMASPVLLALVKLLRLDGNLRPADELGPGVFMTPAWASPPLTSTSARWAGSPRRWGRPPPWASGWPPASRLILYHLW